MRRKQIFVDMKHESIVVVYDSCLAIAEEIAGKLGAETVSVQSMSTRQIENSQSLIPQPLTLYPLSVMIYIVIVALEFLLAFVGVGLLIRYYNHKA